MGTAVVGIDADASVAATTALEGPSTAGAASKPGIETVESACCGGAARTIAAVGAGLAWLRSKTGSVYPGMATHAIFNGIAVLSVIFR